LVDIAWIAGLFLRTTVSTPLRSGLIGGPAETLTRSHRNIRDGRAAFIDERFTGGSYQNAPYHRRLGER
jgi:hypothetical protein